MAMNDSWDLDKSVKVSAISAILNNADVSRVLAIDAKDGWNSQMRKICKKIDSDTCGVTKITKGEEVQYISSQKGNLLEQKYSEGWEWAGYANPNSYASRLYSKGQVIGTELSLDEFKQYIPDATHIYSYTFVQDSLALSALSVLQVTYNLSVDYLPTSMIVEDADTSGAVPDDPFHEDLPYGSYEEGLELMKTKYGFIQGDTLESSYFITPYTDRPLITIDGKDYFFCDISANTSGDAEVTYCSISKENTGTEDSPIYQAVFGTFLLGLTDTTNNGEVFKVEYLNTSGERVSIYLDVEECPYIKHSLDKSIFGKDCYPIVPLRMDKKSLDEWNPTLYESYKRLFTDTSTFDFENAVGAYNAKKELMNNEDSYDQDYADSLKDVTQIHMVWAVALDDNDETVKEYIFHYFKDLMERGVDEVQIQNGEDRPYPSGGLIGALKKMRAPTRLHNSWKSITSNTVSGRALHNCHWGIVSSPVGDGTTNLEIFHQYRKNNSDVCEILTVKNFKVSLFVEGKWRVHSPKKFSNMAKRTPEDIAELKAYRDTDDGKDDAQHFDLIPLLRHVVNDHFSAFSRTDLLRIGIRILLHTKIKVKKKWYQTTFFKVVCWVVTLVLLTYFPPIGMKMAVAQFAVTLAIATSVNIALKLVVKALEKWVGLDPRWGMAIQMVGAIVTAVYGAGILSLEISTFGSFIGLGNMLTSFAENGFDLTSLTYSALTFAVGNAVGSLTSTMSTVASTSITESAKLLSNVQFLDAVGNGDWNTIILSTAQLMASIGMSYLTSLYTTSNPDIGSSTPGSPETPSVWDNIYSAVSGYGIGNIYNTAASIITYSSQRDLQNLQKDLKNFENAISQNQEKWKERYTSIYDTTDITNATQYLLLVQNLKAVNNPRNFQIIKKVI